MSDDPLFILMKRGCRISELLPSKEELLHDEDARHRTMMLVAEMRKIEEEIRAMARRERDRRRADRAA